MAFLVMLVPGIYLFVSLRIPLQDLFCDVVLGMHLSLRFHGLPSDASCWDYISCGQPGDV